MNDERLMKILLNGRLDGEELALWRRELAAVAGEGAGSVGRNAPCPCGSGLKFKRCRGR